MPTTISINAHHLLSGGRVLCGEGPRGQELDKSFNRGQELQQRTTSSTEDNKEFQQRTRGSTEEKSLNRLERFQGKTREETRKYKYSIV